MLVSSDLSDAPISSGNIWFLAVAEASVAIRLQSCVALATSATAVIVAAALAVSAFARLPVFQLVGLFHPGRGAVFVLGFHG